MTDPASPRNRGPDIATLVVGGVFLAIGVWYFLDDTLALQMPDISWGSLWPVFLIVLGAVIIWRAALDRRS